MVEDRLSPLPDCLLIDILSRLPSIDYAIRTGTLSKRWQHLWKYVPNLIFRNKKYGSSDMFSHVDKTLTQCRQLKLNIFEIELYSCYEPQFESYIRNWIRYAINYHVEHLTLTLQNRDMEPEFELDSSFFVNSDFTYLNLEGCVFNPATVPEISWKNLKSLRISIMKLDEDMIENILSGCPSLETLTFSDCYGYSRIDITSKSVKKFVLSGYFVHEDDVLDDLADVIGINAPNILSLTIEGDLLLWKIFLLDVSSVVKADLDYIKLGHSETTRKKARVEMLKEFILRLRHVKELTIGICSYTVFLRLEATGFIFPSNLKLPNLLEVADLIDWSDSDSDESGD